MWVLYRSNPLRTEELTAETPATSAKPSRKRTLSAEPVLERVEITVDGVPWSGDWFLNEDGEIILEDEQIMDGAIVEVSYVAQGECVE